VADINIFWDLGAESIVKVFLGYRQSWFGVSSDPGENANLWEYNMETGWMFAPGLKTVGDYMKSDS
jgi:hypothetical protein